MKAKLYLMVMIISVSVLTMGRVDARNVLINKIENRTIDQSVFSNIKGLFYTIQIGVFSRERLESDFDEVTYPLYGQKRNDNKFVYYSGLFDCRFKAIEKRFEIVNSGIYDAFIVIYYNGEAISMNQSDKLLAEKGKSVLFSAQENDCLMQFAEK